MGRMMRHGAFHSSPGWSGEALNGLAQKSAKLNPKFRSCVLWNQHVGGNFSENSPLTFLKNARKWSATN
jgi:hypothetical protein